MGYQTVDVINIYLGQYNSLQYGLLLDYIPDVCFSVLLKDFYSIDAQTSHSDSLLQTNVIGSIKRLQELYNMNLLLYLFSDK